MRKLLVAAALGLGAMLFAFGGAGDAEAKPKGWHGGKGDHYAHSYGPRRHYGWNRGRHLGWYKHRQPRRSYYRY